MQNHLLQLHELEGKHKNSFLELREITCLFTK